MKIRTRILLAGLAGFLGALATLAGPSEAAHSAPPKFPTCYRAPVDHDSIRVWLNPGTLYSPNAVSVDGTPLGRRRDGIFTGVIDKPKRDVDNYILFTFDNVKNGIWVKCRLVTP